MVGETILSSIADILKTLHIRNISEDELIPSPIEFEEISNFMTSWADPDLEELLDCISSSNYVPISEDSKHMYLLTDKERALDVAEELNDYAYE